MKLLAFDTSTNICTAAIFDSNRAENDQIAGFSQLAKGSHGQIILDGIHLLLKNHDLKLNELDALVFGCGPGSLTGVRISCSIAQGLGLGANLPVIPVSSLALYAQSAWFTHARRNIAVAVDARMQEVYLGTYVINAAQIAELQDSEILLSSEAFAQYANDSLKEWDKVGDGWLTPTLAAEMYKINTNVAIQPKALIHLGQNYFNSGKLRSAKDALPVYLR